MKTFVLSALVCLLLSSCTNRQPEIFTGSSTAINGYDPVAYFTDQKPTNGKMLTGFFHLNKIFNYLKKTRRNMRHSMEAIAPMVVQKERKSQPIQTHGQLLMENCT
jgi:hypothetical protein